jgi:hypothetical protein
MTLEPRKSSRRVWTGRMLAPVLVVLASWSSPAYGDSPVAAVLQASDTLYLRNPVKRIALLASGFVAWPTHDVDVVVDIALSRQAQEKLLLTVKKQLEAKGYQVAVTMPAGVAFVDPAFDYDHLKYLGPNNEELRPLGIAPLFLNPAVATDRNLSRAVRDLLEPMLIARSDKALARFQPNPESAKLIAHALDPTADAFCSLQLAAVKYSAANRTGTLMRAGGLAAVIIGSAAGFMSDEQRVDTTCFSGTDGTVLWQDSASSDKVDPANPTDHFAATLLQYLPGRGYRMNPQIRRAHGGPPTTAKTGP